MQKSDPPIMEANREAGAEVQGKNKGDAIALCALHTYTRLPKQGKPQADTEWTVLAAFILQIANRELKTVALATGSKCIGLDLLDSSGHVVIDSHAEVLARRALQRYFCHQAEMALSGCAESEFFEIISTDQHHQRLRQRENCKLHLYISQTPCGDAAIFEEEMKEAEEAQTKANVVDAVSGENAQKRSKLDLHRTGAKPVQGVDLDPKQPGTAYHRVGLLRTKPGRGPPSHSLSCSDKIMRWCYLGLQGSLLARAMDPIYLASIVVGEDFHEAAVSRALWSRLQHLPSLRKFSATKLEFLHTSIEFTDGKVVRQRRLENAKQSIDKMVALSASIVFVPGTDTTKPLLHEVLVKGIRQGASIKKHKPEKYRSQVCKLEAARRGTTLLKEMGMVCDSSTYALSKQEEGDYVRAKVLFLQHFPEWKGNVAANPDDFEIPFL
eukprot:m.76723 g.76723  ORF g.76723 m.76723 type:complete len:439 (+) comp14039_c0_seq1:95-1411(+)